MSDRRKSPCLRVKASRNIQPSVWAGSGMSQISSVDLIGHNPHEVVTCCLQEQG